MIPKRVFVPATAGIVLAIFAGCADLKSDLPSPVAPGVKAHGPDWSDTTSAGFHGNAIRAANWDMKQCQVCHGSLYDGGTVDVSCRKCHTGAGGPENCSTCHGSPTSVAPPRDLSNNTSRSARGVGAHQVHLNGSSISGTMLCSQCHTTPGSVYAPGHIDSTHRAKVLFNSPLANTVTNEPFTIDYNPEQPLYTPSPSYNPSTLQCSNVYCHGYFKNGNQTFSPTFVPTWNDTTGVSGACGTCHGDVTVPLDTLGTRYVPRTTSHGGTHPEIVNLRIRCVVCHGDVVDANFHIINPSKHINGKLNVFGEERDF